MARVSAALGEAPAALPTPITVGLCAPLAGWLLSLSAVPDPVFSDRVLGDGFAIDPTEATLRAPFDGIVTSLHRAGHALTMRADNGAEVLIHIGLDTVALRGDGFTAHVVEGARVTVGAPLIDFDMDVIAQRVRSLVVPVVLTNGDAFVLGAITTGREVACGEPMVEIRPIGTAPAPSPVVAADPADPVERRTVKITDPFGIHARPAGLLAAFVRSSPAAVTISFGGRTADPKSPTALMLLGAECGDVLTVEARGPAAADAATKIAAMLGTEDVANPVAPAPTPAPAPTVAAPLPTDTDTDVVRDLSGVTAAPGIAVGLSHRLDLAVVDVAEVGGDRVIELAALTGARDATRGVLTAEIAGLGPDAGSHGEILGAHLAFVDDPDLVGPAEDLIDAGKSAGFAWKTAIDGRVAALRALGKPILIERAADLLDVQRRVLLALSGGGDTLPVFSGDTILFADDLLPSQFTGLDLTRVVGLVLAGGGPTSHLAILAASRGLPAIVAVGPDTLRVADGQTVLLDADAATVRIGAAPEAVATARRAAVARRERAAADLAAAHTDCRMADGTRIEVFANLGGPDDVAGALAHGAEGCGLMRSEFLFLDRATAPSEDEQLSRYQTIATGLEGRPLIVRTLDAGADKKVPYADLPTEENPALGTRGIRLSLARPDLLHAQIRAILRVEPHGQTRIMLPMVATLEDLRTVKRVVEAERAALGREEPIEVGIMVEVPSVALIADRFAAEADFFSIGTNDLTQYTLAMDRGNPRFAGRTDPLHPAVLRLVALAAEAARAQGKWTGVCGSLASLPLAAPILIGLGVTELSATPDAIPAIKALVRTLTLKRCIEVADAALRAESGAAVRRLSADAWPDA